MELLAPLSVQVLLAFALLFLMGYARIKSIVTKQVHPKDISNRQPNWPERVTRIGNAYHNQLELPLLFYVLIIVLIITKLNDTAFLYLAWTYVVLRLVHAAIHISTKRSTMRFFVFAASCLVLFAMWLRFFMKYFL